MKIFKVSQKDISPQCFCLENKDILQLKKKIEDYGTPLKDLDVIIYRGVLTGYNAAFIIDNETKEHLCKEDPKSIEILKPMLRGRDIKRYHYEWKGLWLINSHNGYNNINKINVEKDYPAIFQHLQKHKTRASKRCDKGNHWTNLRNCAYLPEFEKEKIVWQEISQYNPFTWETGNIYQEASSFLMTNVSKYLLGVLNSNVQLFYLSKIAYSLGVKGLRWKKIYVEQLPIPTLNLKTKQDKSTHDKMVNLVNQMLELNKHLLEAKTPHEKNRLQREIAVVDNQINNIVYKLYNLTTEEIKIIEEEINEST